MKKKTAIFLFLISVSLLGYAQENRIVPPDWNELQNNFPDRDWLYHIPWETIAPSLSYTRELMTSNFQLMEIDLSIDLRRQAYQDKTALLVVPKNKFVISEFNLARPVAPKSAIIITGRRRLDYSVNRGEVKNSVYKDASFYTGAYNPFTGLPY